MKKYFRTLLLLLLGMLVAISGVSIKRISDIRDYGKLINYVGIVRGASQRVVKLETNGRPDDELTAYVEGILNELITGQGVYGLVLADCRQYQLDLDLLKDQWDHVKKEIGEVRQGARADALIDSSERLFEIANDTVFTIEQYSGEMAEKTARMIFATALVSAAAFAFTVYFYIRKFFQLKVTNEKLEELTSRDELTGAYRADKFYSEVNRMMEREPDAKFAVLYIDFENFKYVNDVFGYSYGDDLLKGYAQLVMSRLKEEELLARDVADRFVLLRRYETQEELLETQKMMDEEFLNSDIVMLNRHMLTIACGICCAEDLVEEPEAVKMVNRANFAQKEVKNKPGKHYAFYGEEIRQKLIAEMAVKDRMQEGLDNEEFVVYLQPKVGVEDGAVKGAEALVRWAVPGNGLLSPGLFIPVLEKNHFIGKVDRYVFEKVCKWLHDRMANGKTVVPISVNVSKIQFYNPDFIPVYAGIKKQYGIPDGMLEIELTESAAFEHEEYLMQVVRELHDNGFLCSLDDFGTGYSSLGLLKDLPIDVMKLDGVFFRVSVDVNRGHTILKYIIDMVKELNISTVAEGVEREEQVEFLKSAGCDLIQGFAFYRPMPVEQFEEVLDGPV
ncbi:bifunctional diguanylate cyclase/phosphodiesterase [Hungatella hathewayi]|uniref:putative bifunctional diguanylate cyclase/phosphodiesterase n=1 Tax=Hungatella hathewayi TaxID=154046 RepID=UPI00210AF077|nr:bifunctional diguanylate cyclase/phosphodiesterase [Hungatella hathewayi]MCQ5384583.1 bifunctional diguanylate cyclase/phosphodiesterase [Hungatella hathewayi]